MSTASEVSPTAANDTASLAHCSLGDFVRYVLKLGTFGFGGPIALAGYVQRDLVEQRRRVSKQDDVQGSRSPSSPGSLAAPLAIYLGWVRGG